MSGCSLLTYNTATEQREFIIIPTDVEVSMGNDIHKQISSEFNLSKNQRQLDRLKKIGNRLAAVSDRQDYSYKFFLLEKNELNAFTTPGGNVYVLTGLMDKLDTDDEVAAVLAHEIGHCAARHTIKKFQAAVSYNIIGSIIFSQLKMEEQVQRLAALSTNMAMNLIFSAYSRKDELQADRLGLKYMYLAGFDVNGMIKTFEILKKESNEKKGIPILRTHPYIDDRITMAKQEIEKITHHYQ